MKTYQEYYIEAKKNYEGSNPKKDLYSFTHEVILPGYSGEIITDISKNFYNLIEKASITCNERLSNDELCYWPTGVDRISKDNDIVKMCRDVVDIQPIEDIAKIIIPQIEKNLYGSHVQVQNLYVYRNNVTDRDPRMSWLWHYDNHPYEYMKCMIYLTDVGSEDGALEIMEHPETKLAAKHQSYRTSYKDWRAAPNNSRFSKDQMKKIENMGYKFKKICGPRGTIIIFNENIIHRANVAKENHRDVINFMIKPSVEKLVPHINKEYTGSFQNKDMFMDPSHRGLVFK